jgi:hypothetical protein
MKIRYNWVLTYVLKIFEKNYYWDPHLFFRLGTDRKINAAKTQGGLHLPYPGFLGGTSHFCSKRSLFEHYGHRFRINLIYAYNLILHYRNTRLHIPNNMVTILVWSLIRNEKTIVLFERHCHATEKSEAVACARRCRSSRLKGW